MGIRFGFGFLLWVDGGFLRWLFSRVTEQDVLCRRGG
jgi:hypothetical protein